MYGSIDVITGCMFSGKTDELCNRLHAMQLDRHELSVFKPLNDTRGDPYSVNSHKGTGYPAISISSILDIANLLYATTKVVAIDEVQLFPDSPNTIYRTCRQLANLGIKVIVVGVDQDFQTLPFMSIALLMTAADTITKLNATCAICGAYAMHSKRMNDEDLTILIGASAEYSPRCHSCFYV